jgi:hypothetical protein
MPQSAAYLRKLRKKFRLGEFKKREKRFKRKLRNAPNEDKAHRIKMRYLAPRSSKRGSTLYGQRSFVGPTVSIMEMIMPPKSKVSDDPTEACKSERNNPTSTGYWVDV